MKYKALIERYNLVSTGEETVILTENQILEAQIELIEANTEIEVLSHQIAKEKLSTVTGLILENAGMDEEALAVKIDEVITEGFKEKAGMLKKKIIAMMKKLWVFVVNLFDKLAGGVQSLVKILEDLELGELTTKQFPVKYNRPGYDLIPTMGLVDMLTGTKYNESKDLLSISKPGNALPERDRLILTQIFVALTKANATQSDVKNSLAVMHDKTDITFKEAKDIAAYNKVIIATLSNVSGRYKAKIKEAQRLSLSIVTEIKDEEKGNKTGKILNTILADLAKGVKNIKPGMKNYIKFIKGLEYDSKQVDRSVKGTDVVTV